MYEKDAVWTQLEFWHQFQDEIPPEEYPDPDCDCSHSLSLHDGAFGQCGARGCMCTWYRREEKEKR